MDREHEEQMINNFRSEMEEKIKEKEREQQEEKQERERKEEAVEEEAEVATKVMEMVTEEVASEVESQEGQTEPALPKDESIKVTKKIRKKTNFQKQVEVHATAVHHELLEPKVAARQAHEISHSQAVSFYFFSPKKSRTSQVVSFNVLGICPSCVKIVFARFTSACQPQ